MGRIPLLMMRYTPWQDAIPDIRPERFGGVFIIGRGIMGAGGRIQKEIERMAG